MIRGEYFDHDPLTGLVEYYEEVDGKVHIHTYQDVEPILENAKRLRNEGGPDEAWKERGWTMYAQLPAIAVGQMLKKGINLFDQNDIGRVVKEVNENYAYCKTTYKHHEVK